jgi:uncharacterized membrane protein
MTIRNPAEWGFSQFRLGAVAAEAAAEDIGRATQDRARVPTIAHIGRGDLLEALAKGWQDFQASRTDIIFLCLFYPVIGLLLGAMASGGGSIFLVFPLVAGFALIGPLAGLGLYEMSRRREQGATIGWADAFGVLRSRSLAPIALLGLALLCLLGLWLFVAGLIYHATLGPAVPASVGAFLTAVFTTGAGWTMIVLGCGVGFLFALLVLSIAVVSFPLMLDRNVGLETAVWTSVRAVLTNPRPMAEWGLIVAAALVAGSIPLLVGMVVVLPVLGHATWHLYRKLVPQDSDGLGGHGLANSVITRRRPLE